MHPGKRLRGIGEPIWAARTPAEMAECHRHEGLLNVAFADSPGFWLLCPYDTTTLDPADVAARVRDPPAGRRAPQRRLSGPRRPRRPVRRAAAAALQGAATRCSSTPTR